MVRVRGRGKRANGRSSSHARRKEQRALYFTSRGKQLGWGEAHQLTTRAPSPAFCSTRVSREMESRAEILGVLDASQLLNANLDALTSSLADTERLNACSCSSAVATEALRVRCPNVLGSAHKLKASVRFITRCSTIPGYYVPYNRGMQSTRHRNGDRSWSREDVCARRGVKRSNVVIYFVSTRHHVSERPAVFFKRRRRTTRRPCAPGRRGSSPAGAWCRAQDRTTS